MLHEKYTNNAQDEFVLINIVEEMVRQKVNELIKDIDMCKCEKCRLNACAIALNSLTPHYVNTEKGSLLAKLQDAEVNYQMKLTVEVTKALMIVKEQPLHS